MDRYGRLIFTDTAGNSHTGDWSKEKLTPEEVEELKEFFRDFFKKCERGYMALEIQGNEWIFNAKQIISVRVELK